MKWKFSFLLVGLLLLFCSSEGRTDQQISLNLKNAEFSQLIRSIEQQTIYRFVYNSEQVSKASPVTMNVTKASLNEVLEIGFRNQPLQYRIDSVFIIISQKAVTHAVSSQDTSFYVEGRVTNEQQESLSGASVTVKNTSVGTTVDANGYFKLSGIGPDAVLVFSSVGYLTQAVNLGGRKYVSVSLVPSVNNLEESVVIGYGKTTKRLNTGSVGKVGSTVISQQPVSNFLGALQGRVPGLNIIQSNGVPGGSFTVQIRGRNSIAAGNDPLFIIDGVPVISQPQGSYFTGSSTDYGNPLSSYNPLDIESVEVLKDADATAIYGSRAANGVILVTTKKGSYGAVKTDVNLRYGFGEVARRIKVLNTAQYREMRYEAFKNDGANLTATNAPDLLLWDSTKNTDWQDKLIGGSAEQFNGQVSVSGGSEKLRFLISGNVYSENTVFPGDYNYLRYNGHYNFSFLSNDKNFSLSLTGGYGIENNLLPNNTFPYMSTYVPPNAPDAFNNDGSLHWERGFQNPYQSYKQYINTITDNYVNNLTLGYKFLGDFEFKLNGGFNRINVEETRVLPKSSYDPGNAFLNATSSFADRNINSWIAEPQITYGKFFKNIKLLALVGTSFQELKRKGSTISADGFSNDFVLTNMAAASSLSVIENIESKYRYNGVFGRVNLDLRQKYLLNLNFRRDGSSRFGSENKYSNFGSIGAAWIFSDEKLVSETFSFISFGKIRSSFGTTGNDQIGDYQYLDTWAPVQYPYQNVLGFAPTRLANPDYRWELNKRFEVALELGLFKDAIFLTASYYNSITTNQLVGYPLPVLTGFNSIQQNLPARIRNFGWEFQLSANILSKTHFKWNSSVNLTVPRNKLIEYPNFESSSYTNTYVIGEPLSIQKSFGFLGPDPATGIYVFEDVNKDGTFSDPADRQYVKFVGQKLYGGFYNSIRFSGFEIDIFFYGAIQEGRKWKTAYQLPGRIFNQPIEVLDRWRKPGDITSIQRFSQSLGEAYVANNDNNFYGDNIENTSFIKLKNAMVGYLFPIKNRNSKSNGSIKVYLEGQNLFVITGFKGFDPEVKDLAFLPSLRVITGGIQFKF